MSKWSLHYCRPAKSWYEALPLGSGSLGAMVFGDTRKERLALNLDTLWSGDGKRNKANPKKADMQKLQEYIFAGEHQKAEDYAREHIFGDWTECYLPAGNLYITLQSGENETDYRRQLHLHQALYEDSWEESGKRYHKEVFISLCDDVLALRLWVEDGNFSAEISIDSLLRHSQSEEKENALTLLLQAPIYAAPDYLPEEEPIRYAPDQGLSACLHVEASCPGGRIAKKQDRLCAVEVRELYLFLTGVTDFKHKGCLREAVSAKIRALLSNGNEVSKMYKQMKERHIRSYESYFQRFDFHLGKDVQEDTLRVLEEREQVIYPLMLHYARYLMICSSKPGTECANLQGIWNERMRAPWSSNYTVNINTQMNYWFVEAANLAECHTPLFDLVERAVEKGKECARQLYGMPGFVTHHNIDLWGHATPVGRNAVDRIASKYALWPMSGGWLCRHFWEHYLYGGDTFFLEKRAHPVIEEAVRFYTAYLTQKDGYLVTCPSTSPENEFLDGERKSAALSFASTMDIGILRELFSVYKEICSILNKEELVDTTEILQKLPPFRIGKYGQLQEWIYDYEEQDVHHRHVSHLYALYPGSLISRDMAVLREAVRRSLERRKDEGTGWCIAWKACLFARLLDGNRALELLDRQLRLTREENVCSVGGGTYPNLFCAHPPFQIDGNFGFGAAILEMLLQNEGENIYLLPALPGTWSEGSVKGMRARGGFTLDFSWTEGRIEEICIRAGQAASLYLHYNGLRLRLSLKKGEEKQIRA